MMSMKSDHAVFAILRYEEKNTSASILVFITSVLSHFYATNRFVWSIRAESCFTFTNSLLMEREKLLKFSQSSLDRYCISL